MNLSTHFNKCHPRFLAVKYTQKNSYIYLHSYDNKGQNHLALGTITANMFFRVEGEVRPIGVV